MGGHVPKESFSKRRRSLISGVISVLLVGSDKMEHFWTARRFPKESFPAKRLSLDSLISIFTGNYGQ